MLDHAAARLSQVWLSRFDITAAARPIVERLRDDTDESAGLFVLRDGRQFCVLEATSRQALAVSRGLGEIEHIARGASGKAILAFLDEARAFEIIPTKKAPPRTGLLADFARIRSAGYAISHAEVFVGAVAIAAPVFDRTGGVVGSIGLYGPEARMPAKRLPGAIRLVVDAARALSAELGSAHAVIGAGAQSKGRAP
jgi:DNA-binding IclR family transcriptional regulator